MRAFARAARALEVAGRDNDHAAALRAARTMARLYRGMLLDGIYLSDAPDFELWLIGAREHFHELHLRALREIVVGYRAAARWPDVLATARKALAQDALQEPMYRALIEAHARLGDRAAALRQYALLRDTFERELGVEPLLETEQLRDAVLSGALFEQSAGDVGLQEDAGVPFLRWQPRHAGASAHPFVGRAAELAVLDVAWAAARAGRAQVVLLLGEAGIGKSRLWQIWSGQIDPAATVLAARCLSVTQHLPFAPLVDLLHSPPVKQRLMALAQRLAPSWLADIARLP